jgi:hypothetical protein
MAIVTSATIPATASFDEGGEVGGAIRDSILQFNNLMKQQAALALAFTSDGVLKGTALSRGTTVTLASSQCVITIAGVPVSVAATTAQALGGLGTIPASTWGIIGVDAVAAGTISFVSGAANYTTGYTTEALAIAAAPAKTSAKARIGYLTILASSSGFVVGTDALAGGTGGNPATTTNYYNIASPWDIAADSANAITLGSIALTAKQVGNMGGTALSV